jgi:hypothetical protein
VCASQQGTGEPPRLPLRQGLSALSYRALQRSRILITFHPPPRSLAGGSVGLDNQRGGLDSQQRPDDRPTGSEPSSGNARGPGSTQPPVITQLREGARRPEHQRPSGDRPPWGAGHPPAEQAVQAVPAAQAAQAGDARRAAASADLSGLLDMALIVIGAVLVFGARVTLTRTWAWSWHTGSGASFTLSRMHGICTSAMGELAQGVSGDAAGRCLWVDGTWTAAVLFGGFGFILAAIGCIRMLRGMKKSA